MKKANLGKSRLYHRRLFDNQKKNQSLDFNTAITPFISETANTSIIK